VHDGRGAGQRADGDVDRGLGLDAADQHVMVDDGLDLRLVDRGGSSAGLLVSTITTLSSAVTSWMIAGLSRPQCFSTKAASVFGSPSSTGFAGVPVSFRYQAQMMGEPVESVSGDLWPKTRVVMGMNLQE
jgi:hypothetical protein